MDFGLLAGDRGLGTIFGDSGFSWDLGSILDAGADILGGFLNDRQRQPQQAGFIGPVAGGIGRVLGRNLPAVLGGAAGGAAAEWFGGGDGCGPETFFEPRESSGLRAKRMVTVENPDNGRLHYYVNRGQPVVFSGDYAACRRVQKLARRAGGRGRSRSKSGC